MRFPKNKFSVRVSMLIYKDKLFDDHNLVLCHVAALNAWDRVEESGKRAESFTNIVHGLKEVFNDFFLQRLTSAVNRWYLI